MQRFQLLTFCKVFAFVFLLTTLMLLFANSKNYAAAEVNSHKKVTIGVLAKRGALHCLLHWKSISAYLMFKIPNTTFIIKALSFEEIESAVEKKEVDFIFVNPAVYVDFERQYHVTRIATLCNAIGKKCYIVYGSVIFVRSDSPIKTVPQLKNKKIVAVSRTSLGGWLIALQQLVRFFRVPTDFQSLYFMGTHDAVVMAVKQGMADAGIVRTDTLERMQLEGEISLTDFRALSAFPPGYEKEEFPFLLSTPLYPEWPLAKLKKTPDSLAKKVVAVLFEQKNIMGDGAVGLAGRWTIPQNYQSVHTLLKDLRVGPYKNYGRVSMREAAIQHWPAFLGIFVLGMLLAAFAVYSAWLNRRLKLSQKQVEQELFARQEEEARRKTVENMVRHEFRSPVISVLSALNLLEEVVNLAPDQEEVLQLAKEAAERAMGAIDLQRTLNKIESGTFVPPKDSVDLPELVREVLDEYVEQARMLESHWELRLPEEGQSVQVKTQGDRQLYAVLLSNLLRNALEAGPHGCTIRIVFESGAQPVIRISNPAVVPEEIRDTFFERFTTAGKAHGIGLGTYLVKIIAEGHGGSVRMRTSEDEGTEIEVIFPEPE